MSLTGSRRAVRAERIAGAFELACRMALEGLVSKHRGSAYRPGRCDHCPKIKNGQHPAFTRVADQFA